MVCGQPNKLSPDEDVNQKAKWALYSQLAPAAHVVSTVWRMKHNEHSEVAIFAPDQEPEDTNINDSTNTKWATYSQLSPQPNAMTNTEQGEDATTPEEDNNHNNPAAVEKETSRIMMDDEELKWIESAAKTATCGMQNSSSSVSSVTSFSSDDDDKNRTPIFPTRRKNIFFGTPQVVAVGYKNN
jgi:hypothetical protein